MDDQVNLKQRQLHSWMFVFVEMQRLHQLKVRKNKELRPFETCFTDTGQLDFDTLQQPTGSTTANRKRLIKFDQSFVKIRAHAYDSAMSSQC